MLILLPTDYFTKLLEDDLRAIVKPQYVDQIPKSVKGPNRTVKTLIGARAGMGNLKEVCDTLGASYTQIHPLRQSSSTTSWLTMTAELNHIMEREVQQLSGGELQRFAIGTVCVQKADV